MTTTWISVRIGYVVRLISGHEVTIVSMTKARDILRMSTEVGAITMSARLQAIYGVNWVDVYFEAEGMTEDNRMIKVTPVDIDSIVSE